MDFSSQFDNIIENICQEKIDTEMLKFTLNLHNNPLLSRKAVNDVINTFNNFFSEIFIPFLQKNIERDLKPIADPTFYYRAQFILENSKNIFNKFSTEHIPDFIFIKTKVYL